MALACGAPAPRPPIPGDWSRVAEEAHDEIRAQLAAIEAAPRDAAGYERLARIYHGNELTDLAARSYRIAIDLGADTPSSYYLMGLILREQGDSKEAVAALRRAAVLAPDYAPAERNLGLSLLEAGQVEEARGRLGELVERRPRDVEARIALARALRQSGQLDPALAEIEQALQIEPGNDEAHQLAALTLSALGRSNEARPHFELVGRNTSTVVRDPWLHEVQREAASPETMLFRARALLEAGRLDGARALLDRLVEVQPGSAEVFRMLGDLELRASRPREAIQAYSRAARIDPTDAESHAALAVVLLQTGNRPAAARESDLALQLAPRHGTASVVKATLELRDGQAERAIATLTPLLAEHAALPAMHVVYAEALMATGRNADARRALESALLLQPDSQFLRDKLRSLSDPG